MKKGKKIQETQTPRLEQVRSKWQHSDIKMHAFVGFGMPAIQIINSVCMVKWMPDNQVSSEVHNPKDEFVYILVELEQAGWSGVPHPHPIWVITNGERWVVVKPLKSIEGGITGPIFNYEPYVVNGLLPDHVSLTTTDRDYIMKKARELSA